MGEISRQDRIAACLYAGAIGDASGAAFEGRPPPVEFSMPSDLRVTDDTQLTIATCEAIIERKRVDPESIADRFVDWFRARRITGIGSSTLKALSELEAGGHWALVGATGERSAGNGAAMRIAPLAFFLDPDDAKQRQTIRDVCRITHRNEEAYIGALAILRTVRHVAAGNDLQTNFLEKLAGKLPDSRVRDRLVEISAKSTTIAEYATEFGVTGYVVDSVPCAILAVASNTDLLSVIKNIVQCGGDTDTIASMAAQIHGTAHGMRAIPGGFIDKLDVKLRLRDVVSLISALGG